MVNKYDVKKTFYASVEYTHFVVNIDMYSTNNVKSKLWNVVSGPSVYVKPTESKSTEFM